MTRTFVLSLLVVGVCVDAQLSDPESVAQEFFDCCETGKGWDGCSKYVKADTSPFIVEAIDALPGPKVTECHTVKDYLNWMAGVVKEFGAKATYKVKAHSFEKETSTALYYAVFGGFSDYVYTIEVDPAELKVSGMTKVWNDAYAKAHLPPGTTQQAEQPQVDAQDTDSEQLADIAKEFFDCCETGKGWAGCSKYVGDANASFSVQAVDALPGPKITDAKTVKDYLDWMAGVVKAFGKKATYYVERHAYDTTTNTAIYYAKFAGYSDYVYMIDMCPKCGKVRGMTKVWNDQYAKDNMPPSEELVVV